MVRYEDETIRLIQKLMANALLGLFFEPFIFENLPASEQSATLTYLDQVAKCDIYIGLFGKEYGHEDKNGISPTEHEFNQAAQSNKTRLIFYSYASLLFLFLFEP